MEIAKETTLDLIDTTNPALSSTNDLPVVETKPDSVAAPEPEVEVEAEQTEESATSPEIETAASDEPKKAKGVQKRLDELIKQREEEKQEKLRLLALLEAREEKPKVEAEPVKADVEQDPPEPSENDFADPDAYKSALRNYYKEIASNAAARQFKQFQAENERKAQETAIAESQKRVIEAYNERVAKVQEKYPDFEQVGKSPDVRVSGHMLYAIINHENGPDLQYYCGKNPAEVARIEALPPERQLIEIGQIIASLNAPSKPAPVVAVSAAPKPIKPISAGTESITKNPEEMSMDEYAAWRKQQSGNRPLRH
jgi:hypothetical protein